MVKKVPPQFAEEERVATAALRGRRGQRTQVRIQLLVECSRHELLDARRVESAEPDAGNRLAALQIDERLRKWIGDLGRPVAERCDDHQARRRTRTHQVSHQLERLTTRPMHVVEQYQQRSFPGRARKHTVHSGKEQISLGLGICRRRTRQPGQQTLELRQQDDQVTEVAIADADRFNQSGSQLMSTN